MLEIVFDSNGNVGIDGLLREFIIYEDDIFFGRIDRPYKVEHKNSKGIVVSTGPIPLTPFGKPKIDLFGK